MNKASKIIIPAVIAALVLAAIFLLPRFGTAPSPEKAITRLKVPDEFQIEIFAGGLPGARAMVQDGMGNFWVSRTSRGAVTLVELENGKAARKTDVFKGLNNPHGLAIDPSNPFHLYIAESDRITRTTLYSEPDTEQIIDLPDGGRHFTRTIAFGPDDRLYVSIGSSCDVCHEEDNRRAKIFSMNRDGSDFREEARGLRNSVFFAWNYVDGKMWAADMGRDWLGDDLPPDEINIIERGKNYGWPICYGKNIHDAEFDKNVYIRNPCMEPFETPSFINIPAHSSPLGIAFVPEEGWPEEYWYNLMIAYHGSWNRSAPTGYKVVRAKLTANGEFLGFEDFITGWLEGVSVSGRPVNILTQPGGNIYITDDHAGVIYKVSRKSLD